jgi:DNA-binding CsgD family transcriptional regulator
MTVASPAVVRAGLVGRDAELATILEAARRAPATGLVVAVVSGEPGIGKSRLLAEAAGALAGRGWSVFGAAADALQRRIPYAALLAAVRAAEVPGDAEPLRRETLAALDPIATGTTADARFGRACEATTRLLTAVSTEHPVALAVDDLDQLDGDSAALFTVVLRRISAAPVALIGTVRAAHSPAADALRERLAEYAETVDVVLAPLSAEQLGTVIAPLLGSPVDADLAREVHRRADGNPFFATEIARSLRELELVAIDGGLARLAVEPAQIRLTRHDALLRRVAPLGGDVRTVAQAVAVLRRVRLDQLGLLARVAAVPEPVVAAAFDELLGSGLVVRDAEDGYRLSHALVADALYEGIGPARRRQLHGLVAARLLDDRARGLPVDVHALAWHLSESAERGDEVAVGVLVEAATLARAGAPETAAALCARALELLPERAGRRAEVLSLRCRALARASRPAAAVQPGRAALALLPPGANRARVATTLISSLFAVGRVDEAMTVADAEVGTGRATATVQAQRAMLLVLTDRHAEALAGLDAIGALPMSSPAEEVVVFGQLAMLSSMLHRHDRTVEHANRALRASAGSPALELQALAVGATTGALSGLVHDAAWRLRRAEELVAGGDSAFRGEILATRLALDWLRGRWDTALDGLGRAAVALAAREEVLLRDAVRAIELEIRCWRGELDLAARLAAAPTPPLPNMARLHALALAHYRSARGDVDGARDLLERAADRPETSAYSCVLLGRLIDLHLAADRPDRAATALATLVDVAADRVSPWSVTTVHRAVGLVRGDAAALRRAIEAAGTGGLAFEQARAQLALGELDPSAAAPLTEAYLTFQRLGAGGLRCRAGSRLRELGAKVPRARSKPAGLLTETEEQVARLVQQGLRNRDIATALHYSPRTIEVYLSRIYGKLRVSSRLELARALDGAGPA